MDASFARVRTAIGAASLVVGPAMMSVGDLIHPPERSDAAAQVAIIAESASRWYGAHLLLFLGMLLFVPGILALTQLTADRKPAVGFAGRLALLVSVGALSAVFVFEMLLGRFIALGADVPTSIRLLQTFQAGAIFGAIVPGLIAFFVGTALVVVPLLSAESTLRWPAIALALGALLIMGEIILAEVLLSQLGNILILVAGSGFAAVLLRRRGTALA